MLSSLKNFLSKNNNITGIQRTFLLKKKENDKSKNKTVFYSLEAEMLKARQEAERRNCSVHFDSEVHGLVIVEDYQEQKEVILYDKKCLQCSCLEFLSQETNSCLHIEVLKRLWHETSQEDLSWIKSVFGHSQKNFLLFNPFEQKYFISSNSSSDFISQLHQYGLTAKENELIVSNIAQFISSYRNLNFNFSPVFKNLILRLEKTKNNSAPIIPSRSEIDSLLAQKLTLYEYQYEAIEFLAKAEKAILALPMGYGKTLISILLSHLLQTKRILIISPATIKNYWQTEYEKFTGLKFKVLGSKKEIENAPDKIILSYELAQRNIEILRKDWDLIIVDEVQRIRNGASKVWNAVNQLSSRYVFALSGTVIETGIEDLLSIVRYLYPNLFSPEWKFHSRFSETEGPKILGLKNSEELKVLLSSFIFRAPETLSDVKLPPINHQVMKVKMDSEQSKHHDNYYQQASVILSQSFSRQLTRAERNKLNVLLLKSRQACNSAKLIFTNSKEIGQKYSQALKLIQNLIAKNNKIVVYSEWIESLALLETLLNSNQIGYIKLTGKVKSNTRIKLVEEFITNHEKKIFLSTDAGGYGLDGLQLASSHVIHLELPWNPGKLDQRNGRVCRLLQKATEIQAYYLVAENSVEEKVQKANERRRKIRFQVLG